MSIPDEVDPFALDDDSNAGASTSQKEREKPDDPWSVAASRALPAAASLLARPPTPTPANSAKVARAADEFRLESPKPPEPPPGAPQAPGAAARAREAYEAARAAAVQIEVEPFRAPPRIDPDKLDALAKATGEVVLDSALGTIALVPKPTGRLDRTELTFEEAATLRTLVDAFPGSRIIGIRSAAQRDAEDGASRLASSQPANDGHGEGAPSASARSARSAGAPSMTETAWTGTRCSACGHPQFTTPSGTSCARGHGNADPAGDAAEFDGDEDHAGGNTELENALKNATSRDVGPSRTNTLEAEPDPFALD